MNKLGRSIIGMASLIGTPVWAADMAVKAPPSPPAPAVATWTGYYVGLNVGYGSADDPNNEATVSGAGFPFLGAGVPLYGGPFNYDLHPQGIVGGAQIGYNYQLSPIWVAGLEADFQGSGMRDSNNCVMACGVPLVSSTTIPVVFFPSTFSTDSEEQRVEWFGTVRGRLGYTFGSTLAYATGGLAYGNVERRGTVVGTTAVNSFAGSFDNSSTNVGWTVGGGLESKLWGNWSAKAEYLYIDLGRTTDSFNTLYSAGSLIGTPGTVAATRTDTTSYHLDIIRFGVNYKFGG